VFRLLRDLKQDGATSMLSKRRGKPSNHRLPAEIRTLALSIVRERYPDFGPTFAAEKLADLHGVVSPNRRKFRQAESWPRCAPHGQTFRISGQIRKVGASPRASRRVPSHRIAPRQPSKTGKFPLAGRSVGRNPARQKFRRLGLTTPSRGWASCVP
jgi:hypothetical protein